MCTYDKTITTCIHCTQLLSIAWKKKALCSEPTVCCWRRVCYESRCLVACGCTDAVDVMQPKDGVQGVNGDWKRGLKRKRSSDWLRRAACRLRQI
jgi:hypothetical protein